MSQFWFVLKKLASLRLAQVYLVRSLAFQKDKKYISLFLEQKIENP